MQAHRRLKRHNNSGIVHSCHVTYIAEMSGFLDWKYLNEQQVIQLEQVTSEVEIKRLITNIFQIYNLNIRKQKILCNFHFFNYA